MSAPNPVRGILRVFDTPDALAAGAADWFAERARARLAASPAGHVTVSLSGGSTPGRFYRRLAEMDLPWASLVWTFGDERFVPPDDADSNYRMARETLLDRAAVPPGNVHPFQTTNTTPEASAEEYERRLRGLGRAETEPLLDITLLGLGEDGHTASLLPGQPVLAERMRWAAPVPQGRDTVRLTLTYPALERSRDTAFLVGGAGKREMLDRILSGDETVPAGRLRPRGALHWFVDRDAAGRWANRA